MVLPLSGCVTTIYAISLNSEQIRGLALRTAFDALGIEQDASGNDTETFEKPKRTRIAKVEKPTKDMPTCTRPGSKQDQLIEMLRSQRGATIDEIVGAFGWQPHTVRGVLAGALKKKLGLEVTSEKVEGRGRVYRI
ncbi:MAG: DUF3489 domain-containing protein [Bauldia sp.]|nr:DUF3489 domain-containing protein [Bauldia sp.]